MPTEERCERHDMVKEFCADCNGVAERLDKEDRDFLETLIAEGWFQARYSGKCWRCVGQIHVGMLIYSAPHGYIGVCCASEV